MISYLMRPIRLLNLLESNVSPREIAFGVCLAMFLGFIPLNGPMAFLLAVFFLIFKINRVATIFTLSLFKAAYLLGLSAAADRIGSYLLIDAGYLSGLWRALTHMPIIAYLDINNTMVAGGLALGAILFLPVYLISKKIGAIIKDKYSEKIASSGLYKKIFSLRPVSSIGKVVGVGAAGKTSAVRSGAFTKRINIRNLLIIVVLLITIHFGTALILSPGLTSFAVEKINEYSGSKITIGKVNFWPLTLSFSINDIKVFDPDSADKRIVKIDGLSARVSVLGALSRRLIFSHISMKGSEIDLEGAPDGSFNIQRAMTPKEAKAKTQAASAWRFAVEKKDWFGKIYKSVKENFSRSGQEKSKKERSLAKKINKEIKELPRGRLVYFKTARDIYLFEAKKFFIEDAHVKITPEGADTVEIDKADIKLGGLAFDPDNGTKFDMLNLRGRIKKGDKAAGKVDIFYSKNYARGNQNALLDINLDDVDLDAVRFVYQDSLPVRIVKGIITLKSKTTISGENIDSRNNLTLEDHNIEPKVGQGPMVGFIPMPVLCDALNQVDPIKLRFEITGTLEKPEFKALQESIITLAKPYIGSIQEKIKNEGMNALGKLLQDRIAPASSAQAPNDAEAGTDSQQAVDAIKSIFGSKEK